MQIDSQTLDELGVFRGTDGKPSLFDALDRTRTPGGKLALKRRLRAPLSDPDRIREVQASLAYITGHRQRFADLLAVGEAMELDAYLQSNAETLSRTALWGKIAEIMTFELQAPDVIREVMSGVHLLRRLLARLRRLQHALADSPPPAALQLLTDELAGLADATEAPPALQDDGIRQLGELESFTVDRFIRGAARERYRRLVDLIHELDALVAMADTNEAMGWTFPQIVEGDPCIVADGLYHPLIPDAVANDVRLAPPDRLLFVTGPNMGGKTTFLKACALATYLAHLGMGVPATALRLTPVDTIFTGLNTLDSLQDGVSFYLAEVRRVRQAAEILASGQRALIVFDELFKGTNVKDAFDASMIVLQGFRRFSGGLCLVSSHLIELAEPLGEASGVAFGAFRAQLTGEGLHFDYQLRPGTSDQRLGLAILQQERIPDILLTSQDP